MIRATASSTVPIRLVPPIRRARRSQKTPPSKFATISKMTRATASSTAPIRLAPICQYATVTSRSSAKSATMAKTTTAIVSSIATTPIARRPHSAPERSKAPVVRRLPITRPRPIPPQLSWHSPFSDSSVSVVVNPRNQKSSLYRHI